MVAKVQPSLRHDFLQGSLVDLSFFPRSGSQGFSSRSSVARVPGPWLPADVNFIRPGAVLARWRLCGGSVARVLVVLDVPLVVPGSWWALILSPWVLVILGGLSMAVLGGPWSLVLAPLGPWSLLLCPRPAAQGTLLKEGSLADLTSFRPLGWWLDRARSTGARVPVP